MRDKILKSKCLHINLSNQATEIQCDATISGPEDFKNEHGVKCTGVWDTGSIGMSIINKGDFAITNVNNKTTMSFRSPSVARINFVTEYEKARKEEEEINRRQNKATKRTQKQRKRKRP